MDRKTLDADIAQWRKDNSPGITGRAGEATAVWLVICLLREILRQLGGEDR